ncbi:carbohydrate kinase [Nocardioides sp. HDW12B]|uniref:carbohydrate kinase family protein n=1 Tax=Nocardioides sp. HDW12B TaxID=2714939 RepID=UPI00140A5D37|nr:carbohydrate kinase [Nocardioides sp. HDW12B]QIK67493.1 carbohydrate kinase [Nocardioides sp. HDW12B]
MTDTTGTTDTTDSAGTTRGTFVAAGEALVDIVVPHDGPALSAPGGSPLNVAVGLSRLGHDALLLTQLGDDDRATLIRDHLDRSGVRLAPESVLPGFPTSAATARLDEHGAASYVFELEWSMPAATLPADAVALHVGSIGVALSPGRASVMGLVQQARDRGLLVTFDPNARPAFTPDADRAWADVRETASYAALVKMSDEDLEFYRPGATPEQVARELLGPVTRLVVLTLGGRGALAFTAEHAVEVAGRTTTVVDTVGAGDSFMAALATVALEHGLDDLGPETLRGLLAAAHEVGAITVSRRGADPPRRDELSPGWPHRA